MMYSNLAASQRRRREGTPSGKGTISERIPGEFSRRDELRGVCLSDAGRRVLFAPPVATDARHR
jgi:hypothetical protein